MISTLDWSWKNSKLTETRLQTLNLKTGFNCKSRKFLGNFVKNLNQKKAIPLQFHKIDIDIHWFFLHFKKCLVFEHHMGLLGCNIDHYKSINLRTSFDRLWKYFLAIFRWKFVRESQSTCYVCDTRQVTTVVNRKWLEVKSEYYTVSHLFI